MSCCPPSGQRRTAITVRSQPGQALVHRRDTGIAESPLFAAVVGAALTATLIRGLR